MGLDIYVRWGEVDEDGDDIGMPADVKENQFTGMSNAPECGYLRHNWTSVRFVHETAVEYEARIAELEARLTQTWHPDWSNYPSWVNYVVSYPGGAFVKFLECAPTADGERTDGRWCWQRIEHEYTPTVFKKPE